LSSSSGLGNHGLYFQLIDLPKPSAAVFIDGSNLYHNVIEARGNQLSPIDFSDLFSQIETLFEIREIRFYDSLKNRSKEPVKSAQQLVFHTELKRLNPKVKIRVLPLMYRTNLHQDDVFRSADSVGIIDECRNLLWNFLENLNVITRTKEKGVDVLIAVEMIELPRQANHAEWAIIISGDADFCPAVKLARSLGLRVLNLHTYPGSSKELRDACNNDALIDFNSITGAVKVNWYDQVFL